jgi:hypothetical protein
MVDGLNLFNRQPESYAGALTGNRVNTDAAHASS